MKLQIISTSNPGIIADKDVFDTFSGRVAGVCYMAGSFEDLMNEDVEKTRRRVTQTKGSGHHSVYDHEYISVYFTDIPKIVAMVINNEKMYTTSEKSARYTKMKLSGIEQELYDKWLNIFVEKITQKYGENKPFFNEKRILKLAQENARYLISIFTPTSMVYTTSYRQWNYLYTFVCKYLEKQNCTPFEDKLKESLKEFKDMLHDAFPYIDKDLCTNEKNRGLSLLSNRSDYVEYYGDVYTSKYIASFAELAQAQRHRTLDYTITGIEYGKYYVPPIIADDSTLKNAWISDMDRLKDNYPQGMLIDIVERGTYEKFVEKMKERKCTYAQLEINQVTSRQANRYYEKLAESGHALASDMKKYLLGSRCTFADYKCLTPCGFGEGVKGTRII